jgi:hypothetical protein
MEWKMTPKTGLAAAGATTIEPDIPAVQPKSGENLAARRRSTRSMPSLALHAFHRAVAHAQ